MKSPLKSTQLRVYRAVSCNALILLSEKYSSQMFRYLEIMLVFYISLYLDIINISYKLIFDKYNAFNINENLKALTLQHSVEHDSI